VTLVGARIRDREEAMTDIAAAFPLTGERVKPAMIRPSGD